jgi:hypothetical protein
MTPGLNDTIMLTPANLLVTKNTRFGLLPVKVKDLAEQIKDAGQVNTYLTVEELAEPGPSGETHWLREGHYRKAAVELLAKEGLEIPLPCTVVEPLEGVSRTKHQISENWHRTDLTPMDMAVAIDELLHPVDGSEGMKKKRVCELFSRAGGRKGLAMAPLSNSMLNIYLSFLLFPKKIQQLIHEGKIGVLKAHFLSKKDKSEWDVELKKAEDAREAEIKQFEDLEASFVADELKAVEDDKKAKEAAEALINAEKIAADAKATAADKLNAAADALKAAGAVPAADKEKKKVAQEQFKAREAEAKQAEKEATEKQAAADKLKQKAEKNLLLAKERAEKLDKARKDAQAKLAGKKLDIGGAEPSAPGDGKVKLKGPEIIKLAEQMALAGSFPKVEKIFKAFLRCINSEITDAQLTSECGWITGERKDRPKHLPKEVK